MQFTANEINFLLDGELIGNPEVKVSQLAKIEEAKEGSLSFLANPKYEAFLYTTQASVVIVNEDLKIDKPVSPTLIRVKDAYSSFSVLLEKYNSIRNQKVGIEQPSFIHPDAKIGKDVYVGAFAYIGAGVVVGDHSKIYPQAYIADGVTIGQNCNLQSGVKVYHDCVLGNRVTIHSNTVIGSDGFGFAPQADGSYVKVSQIGNVIIEDDVEIGANTAIAAQTGVSGSTKIGQNCLIGGQVGVAGHINIANKTIVTAQSGVTKTIRKEGQVLGGTPASPNSEYLKRNALLRQLPDLLKRLES